MIGTGIYIAPEEQMDHENMIAWALRYFMTQEFTALPAESKVLLKQHNKDRAAVAAQEGASGAAAEPAPPGPAAGMAPPPPAPIPG
jgi:hypothetical protein